MPEVARLGGVPLHLVAERARRFPHPAPEAPQEGTDAAAEGGLDDLELPPPLDWRKVLKTQLIQLVIVGVLAFLFSRGVFPIGGAPASELPGT
mmetsp:Transcript_58715/g.182392  ORF Transcript_58715/g.182392 Transcript_58715/m.182392 type:complete len:93 (-) Transcript_58715:157-435(-)